MSNNRFSMLQSQSDSESESQSNWEERSKRNSKSKKNNSDSDDYSNARSGWASDTESESDLSSGPNNDMLKKSWRKTSKKRRSKQRNTPTSSNNRDIDSEDNSSHCEMRTVVDGSSSDIDSNSGSDDDKTLGERYIMIDKAFKTTSRYKSKTTSVPMYRQYNNKLKHLLCHNITESGWCKYGSGCRFAHDISEQVMEHVYKKAYDTIRGNIDLTKINIYREKDLYNILLKRCNVCINCEKGKCSGGYNCRNGARERKYVICKDDLNKGDCDGSCGKIHLTEKGLKPYMSYVIKQQEKSYEKLENKDRLNNFDTDSILDFYYPPDICKTISFEESIFEVPLT